MRSAVIVLGAGRSGTSLVAGLLADAGYHPGDRLLPASEANPTGYFEDPEVNALNDELLAPLLRHSDPPVPPRLSWLAALPSWAAPRASAGQRRRMRAHLARRPLCLKDPRFVYTLDAWRDLLPADTGFACIFRHPSRVADSVSRDTRRDPGYYAGLASGAEVVWAAWTAAYRHVLSHRVAGEPWLWVEADHLVETRDASGLEGLVGAPVPLDRMDDGLRRSRPAAEPARDVRDLHARLLRLARGSGVPPGPRA